MKIDRETRIAIAQAVSEVLMKQKVEDGEVWLSGKDLCARFGMFSPDWLKRNGWRLPRRRVEYIGDDGQTHTTQWGYALHEIQEIIDAGKV